MSLRSPQRSPGVNAAVGCIVLLAFAGSLAFLALVAWAVLQLVPAVVEALRA